jgi:2-polyprenyl-6-methoxyphenol hydroxylase-like FAD-dependent oxidoreductase
MKAIVVGAGFGGLSAAAGLFQRGWDVTVVERAAVLRPVGSGLAVAPNGLRALDTLGVGDTVRKLAAFDGDAAVTRADGRIITRTASKAMIRRFGDAVIPVTRSSLMDVLTALLPKEAFLLGVTARDIEAGSASRRPCLRTDARLLEADVIVAADGVNSSLRKTLFPEHPGAVYSGITAWRLLVPTPEGDFLPGEVWGGGQVFGITPLADGRTYAYAADYAEPGITYADEKAELLRRFGDWHFPVPQLIAATASEAILHNDIYEIAEPLPAYHRGAVAIVGDAAHAMTPHLGQGANQAMEDGVTLAALVGPAKNAAEVATALAQYTMLRAPRGADMVRRSHRMGALVHSTSRSKEAMRNLGMKLAGRLVPDLALRAMDPVVAWQPPQ